ncbi:MAG: hypothetical protein H6Q18_697 [Bacteroidetes bacterium]|nr:hypothetical protein [Bacteroidota bacterium]
MRISLQKIITPSIFTVILTYVLCLGLWFISFILNKHVYPITGYVGTFAEGFLPSQSIIAQLISFILTVLNSVLITQMNNKYAFIRTRTFMPVFIYLLISSFWLPIHGNYVATLASLFVLLAIFLTLLMYKDTRGVEQAFLSFFFLALSSFLVHEFAFLILVFWIGYALLRCLSYRTFFASVIGFITPWILLYSILTFIFNQTELFPDLKGIIYQYQLFEFVNLPTMIYIGIMFLIFSITMIGMSSNTRHDVIQARNELVFFRLMAFGLILILVLRFSNFVSYLPLIAAIYALLSAYTFTLVKNLFYSITFIVFCVVSFAYLLYQLFI